MKTYRVRLRSAASIITPLHADTLWGHLCWLVKWREGNEALAAFLKEFETDPPFVLSDGCPGDLLPAPLHLPALVKGADDKKNYAIRKRLKGVQWLSLEEFQAVQQGELLDLTGAVRKGFQNTTTLHSTINRITGTTGDEGSLFELDEYVLQGHDHVSVHVKIKAGSEKKVSSLFEDLSRIGFGRKRSVGKGAFEFTGMEPFDGFEGIKDPSGFITLSNFVPAATDPMDGHYQLLVKYGKLGGDYATSSNPFKRPIMMCKSGSAFTSLEQKPYFGRMVHGVIPERPEIVQYGYAFAVPAKM